MEEPIRFGTDGWRATRDVFTHRRVRIVGEAIAKYLEDEGLDSSPIAIGYDARADSPDFARTLEDLFSARGIDVVAADRDRPTPLFAFAVVRRALAGAVMITASHNPPEYNGLKFIPHDGAPALPAVTDAIEERLRSATGETGDDGLGSVRTVDVVTPHADHLLKMVDVSPIDDVPVAYDAIHGSGRDVTDAILDRAGATVERLRCDRDPDFGGGAPEPTGENLASLIDAVTDGPATLGIANDGDADRVAVVTEDRGLLDGNLLYAVLYDYLLEGGRSGPAIRTVSTSNIVDRIAEAHGERVVETPVGFKWVARAMAEHDALIGGEESGGYTIRNHVREKDGVLASLLSVAAHAEEPLDRRLDRLLEAHGPTYQDKRNVHCPNEAKGRALAAIADNLPERVAGEDVTRVNDADGFKVVLADGSWLLIRPSGTEPKLRIYAEARDPDHVGSLLDAGESLVRSAV